jgi:hypothetical protein
VHYAVFEPARDNVLDRQLVSTYDALFNRGTLSYLAGEPLPLPFAMMASAVPECVGKIDFIGLNTYNRLHVRAPLGEVFGPGGLHVPAHVPQGDHGSISPYGEAYPKVVAEAIKTYAALRVPMYITENGVPDREDRIRPWMLVNSLRELRRMWQQGYTCAATSTGAWWTTSSGARAGVCASVSTSWTAKLESGVREQAPNSTGRSSPTRASGGRRWKNLRRSRSGNR